MATSTASSLRTTQPITSLPMPSDNTSYVVISSELPPAVITNIILYTVLSIIIIANNVLVICAVHYNPQLRKPTNFLIMSLSAADLIVGVVVLPLRVVELLASEWTRSSPFWCIAALNLSIFSITASVFNLLGVTLERYIAICHPMKYKSKVTPQKIVALITFIWSTAFVISFLPLMGPGRKHESFQSDRRTALCRLADVLSVEYLLSIGVLVCGLPVLLFSTAYTRIFYVARRHEREISSLQVEERRNQQNVIRRTLNMESKAAKTIAIVVSIFYICWTPFIVLLILIMTNAQLVTHAMIFISAVFLYGNSAINPIVYGCLNKDFRNTYKRLVSGLFPKTRVQVNIRQPVVLEQVNAAIQPSVEANPLQYVTIPQNVSGNLSIFNGL